MLELYLNIKYIFKKNTSMNFFAQKSHCLWFTRLADMQRICVTSLCRKIEIYIYHYTCRHSAEWQFSTSQTFLKLSCMSQLDPWNWKWAQIGLEGLELQRASTEWWTWPLWIIRIQPQKFKLETSFDGICSVLERVKWTCGPRDSFVA